MVHLQLLETTAGFRGQTQHSASTWNARNSHTIPHTMSYYAKCMLGGFIACSSTHSAVCPIDVVKCNMQVDPKAYPSLLSGLRAVYQKNGFGSRGLLKGVQPTMTGYGVQGSLKFGLYEVLKDQYMNLAGEELSKKYRPVIWLAASASAEFIADIPLCPMEMLKVKMQTAKPKERFPVKFIPAIKQIYGDRAKSRFPFGSIGPLWLRGIPYTVAMFCCFEAIVDQFYAHVFTSKSRDSYGKPTQLLVTFMSGFLAGTVSAIVSQPADTLVSLKAKPSNHGKSYGVLLKEFGVRPLLTKGLGPRILMIGTITGLQWWIYDTYKTVMGLGTSGGKH